MKRDLQFWSVHVAAIQREGIPANMYAKREGVSLAAIYYWQRKLRATAETTEAAKPAGSGAFVQLRVSECAGVPPRPVGCTLVLASGVRLEMMALPAPEWLADLARATTREMR